MLYVVVLIADLLFLDSAFAALSYPTGKTSSGAMQVQNLNCRAAQRTTWSPSWLITRAFHVSE